MLMLIAIVIDQNPNFFRACVEELGCSASLCIAHEKKTLEIL